MKALLCVVVARLKIRGLLTHTSGECSQASAILAALCDASARTSCCSVDDRFRPPLGRLPSSGGFARKPLSQHQFGLRKRLRRNPS